MKNTIFPHKIWKPFFGLDMCYPMIPNYSGQLNQPWLWFITGGYLVKRWFLPAAARARGQSNDLNREILASNLFNCCKEVINAPPVPSISRCIHLVYRHKNVWEYQWLNFIYNCMSTFLHYAHCKDALLDCSAPGGERCESLTRVDEIGRTNCLYHSTRVDLYSHQILLTYRCCISYRCHSLFLLTTSKQLSIWQ